MDPFIIYALTITPILLLQCLCMCRIHIDLNSHHDRLEILEKYRFRIVNPARYLETYEDPV